MRVLLDVENTCKIINRMTIAFFQVTNVSKGNSLLNIWEVSRKRLPLITLN